MYKQHTHNIFKCKHMSFKKSVLHKKILTNFTLYEFKIKISEVKFR